MILLHYGETAQDASDPGETAQNSAPEKPEKSA